ncbi:restriction endonuclease subunit S [Atlantibacter hermannii]|uniref:restriction endonuclease subunit S n=1 Tax=Atlantibacter hermannii TaxID=565 RepID=UPI0028B24D21|nr:restriction endonuclease subunit S [Atlantibacter hermannii]
MSGGKFPEGWIESELSALGHIVTGKTPSTKESSNFGGDIPFIKPGDLDLGGYIAATADTLTEKGLALVPTLPTNSIVVTCIGNLGKVGITTIRSASNQQINALIPSEKLNVKFIYYQILTLKPWLESQSAATTIAIVNKSKFSQAPFKFPPISEQKIIAEKLDTLLAQVDSTKARLEQIPQILKRFRQAVLAAAVNGNLTKEWRRKNNFNFDNWEKLTLGHIVKNIEAGKNLKCIETPPDAQQYGIIKISAVTWGEYNEEESKTLPDDSLFIESRRISVGDFLISRANTLELLGNPVIVKKVTKNLMLSDKVLRLVMADSDKPWVNIFLRSFDGRREIEFRSTGNQLSMRNIGQKALLEIPIPKPPAEEQAEIVRRVEQLFAYADTIEKQVNNALNRVNSLTQSILAKAFRGELTAQWRAENPSLISGENSAAALLEKIKAERAASGSKKASRKKA